MAATTAAVTRISILGGIVAEKWLRCSRTLGGLQLGIVGKRSVSVSIGRPVCRILVFIPPAIQLNLPLPRGMKEKMGILSVADFAEKTGGLVALLKQLVEIESPSTDKA